MTMPVSYHAFLDQKRHVSGMSGFAPTFTPDWLFDFQQALVDWSVRKGRSAIFADCGLGKTPIQLVWAQNVIEHTNKPVLVIAPLAASSQTVREAEKFSIDCQRSQDGRHQGARVIITNYERLDQFNPNDFAGAVCDESSILKNFDGVTKAAVTEFMRRLEYRLLCTATAAPNDYIELGTSSEAIGELGYTDMIGMFFTNDEGSSIQPMSHNTKFRLKPHAERDFWRWVCSWARALRKPSDLGFIDGAFLLPALTVNVDVIAASRPLAGKLFATPARDLHEQRLERRATIRERCEAVAAKSDTGDSFLAWCHLNDESDLLAKLIPGAQAVSGDDDDDEKEEKFEAFRTGQLRALVTKPRIAGFGMNWQHCHHMSFFPSHSYEQYYQGVRRCWRYGQTSDVVVDVISTEGEADVLGNLRRKAEAADQMFTSLIEYMQQSVRLDRRADVVEAPQLPAWI